MPDEKEINRKILSEDLSEYIKSHFIPDTAVCECTEFDDLECSVYHKPKDRNAPALSIGRNLRFPCGSQSQAPLESEPLCGSQVPFEAQETDASMKCALPDENLSDEDISFTEEYDFEDKHSRRLKERVSHLSDSFSNYLFYLIEKKGLTNAEVYHAALVDKKVFSKIKNNPDYHPQKMTAMCLCVGARLNLDESRDLLARAGYALSPSDMTDVIFSYFIENGIYDMIELDIQLEEYGLKCLIS